MGQRFDEVELEPVPLIEEPSAIVAATPQQSVTDAAPRVRRMLALFIDLSLFVALTLALSPLLPGNRTITTIAALAGFVILTSYYYFAATWLLWGKTVGGAIFDVKVIGDGDGVMSVKAASLRWIGLVASLASPRRCCLCH